MGIILLTPEAVTVVALQLASGLVTAALVFLCCSILARFPGWVRKLRLWREYCASHSKFSRQAGEGKYKWLEDPWSSE